MSYFNKITSILKTYSRFIGPGLMVSVAYMDPGNYSTAVAAGSAYKYNLLFLILLLNCLAIFLQILAAKLGAVTGLDLAANCKANFSFKTNLFIYILAEIAIIATDLAEVVGTAISLNILFGLPLIAGVIITVVDVLIVLMAYRPKGPLLFIRIFEGFVSLLVGATVVCFAIELYQVSHDKSLNFSTLEVLKGFLPNEKVIDMEERPGGSGLFLSLAILGATVMPHSLYLGSGLVQSRLKDFDIKNGLYHPCKNQKKISISVEGNSNGYLLLEPHVTPDTNINQDDTLTPVATPYDHNQHNRFEKDDTDSDNDDYDDHYRPSVQAINDTMTYTIVELVVSLFTVALFVNAAILIVAGATLHGGNDPNTRSLFKRDDDTDSDSGSDSDDYQNADLFTIYHLLSKHLSPTAGFVFALALLCSGQSAGVVCTLAGQMVSEGFLSWSLPPIARRLITRGLAITPCLFVVSFSGREGLAQILNSSQVVLSLLLPVVSAPLIWFTCSKEIMRVPIFARDGDELFEGSEMLAEDDNGFDEITLPGGGRITAPGASTPSKRFKSSEPAIRLQDLRKSHPCAGWEDEDEEHLNHGSEEQHQLISSGTEISTPQQLYEGFEYDRSKSTSTTDTPSSSDDPNEIPRDLETTRYVSANYTEDEDYRIKGYKDYSNGPVTSFMAVLVWGFITSLNLYLIVSMMLGYEVPL